MTIPEGWNSLGCSVNRCCCCPNTVYYPPSMTANVVLGSPGSSSVSFPIYCNFLDCPRDSLHCIGDVGPNAKCCTGCIFDPDSELFICSGEVAKVLRCHACTYILLGADGTPGTKQNGDGMYTDGPAITVEDPENPDLTITVYVLTFDIVCQCGSTGGSIDIGIPCYIEPDSQEPCAWVGHMVIVRADGTIYSVTDFNFVEFFADPPNPPARYNCPMDPWKFSCCDPFRVRFLIGNYEPINWCGSYNNSTYWPDHTEYPFVPGEFIPWNFPRPCCNLVPDADPTCCDPFGQYFVEATCTCADPPPATTHPPPFPLACQENPLPGHPFGYVEVIGNASCFLPAGYLTNCLDYYKPDGC